MTRLPRVEVDLSDVTSSDELHSLLSQALEFPGWYGCNWDAFWDAITALVPMPLQLKLLGWESFSRRLPSDARLLKECLDDMQAQYPEDASDGDTGHRCARLQAFLNDLGFERFRIRASLAHGNPGDKGDRVRLKIRGHHRP